MLCNGYEIPKDTQHRMRDEAVGLNGLDCISAKSNASIMSDSIWQDLLHLLGKDGDQVMLDLILHCGVYIPAGISNGNLIQLSGE